MASLSIFILDIGFNMVCGQLAFLSRWHGTNGQEESPRLEEGNFPLLVSLALQC